MDTWDSGADYKDYMGRWSRPMAGQFLEWLNVPGGRRWVDVGCGTGALAGTIARRAHPDSVVGIDPSPGFASAARGRLGGDVDIRVGDALSHPLEDDGFGLVRSVRRLSPMPKMPRNRRAELGTALPCSLARADID